MPILYDGGWELEGGASEKCSRPPGGTVFFLFFRPKKLENAFKILGLTPDTNIKDVKTKYKFLAKKWHPDVQNKNKSKNNKDKFINITNAYKIILESFTKQAKT